MGKEYCYLVEKRLNGEKFCMFGNLKISGIGISNLFEFVSGEFKHAKFSPFGLRKNVSTGIKYNSKDYKITYQILYTIGG